VYSDLLLPQDLAPSNAGCGDIVLDCFGVLAKSGGGTFAHGGFRRLNVGVLSRCLCVLFYIPRYEAGVGRSVVKIAPSVVGRFAASA
jgi:hypothetical protein